MAKILIVEDDRAILLGLRENLAYEGHAVTEASRGDEALDTVAAVKPDLLILDLMLPGISGLEVRRRIRKNDRRLPNRPDCHRRDAENRCRRGFPWAGQTPERSSSGKRTGLGSS